MQPGSNTLRRKEGYNVVFIGSSGIGKSSIIDQIRTQQFHNQATTVGIVNHKHEVSYKGRKVILILYDTAGQEQFRSISKQFYKDCYVAVFVFAGNDPSSLDQVQHYARQFKTHYQNAQAGPDFVPICIVVRNKIDLESKISSEDIEKQMTSIKDSFSEFAGFSKLKLIETSAKTGENIPNLVNYILEELDIQQVFTQSDQAKNVLKLSATLSSMKQDKQNEKSGCEC